MAVLNAKQQRFVEEYLVDLNAAAAARRAGYSESTAAAQAARLLANVKVAAAIAAAQAERARRTEASADQVVRELARIAFLDPRDLMSWGPNPDNEALPFTVTPRASAELSDDAARCVAEVALSPEGTFKVKLHDKLKALDLLGRHLGLFRDKVEVTGAEGGPVRVVKAEDLTDEQLAAIAAAGRAG